MTAIQDPCEPIFHQTQVETRETIMDFFDDDDEDFWDTSSCGKSSFPLFLPSGADLLHIEKQPFGQYLICFNDSNAKEIRSFNIEAKFESEALNLYCCLPIEITENGFSIVCMHSKLARLVPLFVLFLQNFSAAIRLKELMNNKEGKC